MLPDVKRQDAPPTPRAIDLGRRLTETIQTFERQYPGTSREEIRAAVRLAVGDGERRPPAARAAVLVGALVAGLAVAWFTGGGATGRLEIPFAAIAVAVLVALAAVLAARARSG